MPSQQQIEQFTLVFHRLALARLRDRPELCSEALAVLDRWEANGATHAGQRYRARWRELLSANVDQLEHAVCCATDEAATLRSASPLGFLVDDETRMTLRREVMPA